MKRCIVLVVEGIAPPLLERWAARGFLPFLNDLRLQGRIGRFIGHEVPYEPPALLSAFTGQPCGGHGCFSYWHVYGKLFAETPAVVTANDICAPFLWQMPGWDKVRVSLVNLFGTHPPAPLNGKVISYPLYPSLKACYPPDLLLSLLKKGIRYGHDVSALYTGGGHEQFWRVVRGIEESRMAVCRELLAGSCDLFIANITIIDRLSHFLWAETEGARRDDPGGSIMLKAYQLVDDFIAGVVQNLHPDDELLVFSEIGFGPLAEFVSLNDILALNGLYREQDGNPDPASCMAMEAVQGSHGININSACSYADGIIAPQQEDAVSKEVAEALLSARNRHTGEPLIRAIHRGRDIHPGPNAGMAPHLIVEPYDVEYLPAGHTYWRRKVMRHLQTGWHRRESIWFGIGKEMERMSVTRFMRPTDVAPLIARLMDAPPLPAEHDIANYPVSHFISQQKAHPQP